ncbi:hypothetical protein NPIL_677881 [Nephila pilipes]|uniref:Uncharacterized protein n=1 Tax=Nephila pilipes TaxID=299642 RepID=A0A8X6PFZ1_NEPPI|nr:hypothetical protein NPIL_677881 [Nephila pilipes]
MTSKQSIINRWEDYLLNSGNRKEDYCHNIPDIVDYDVIHPPETNKIKNAINKLKNNTSPWQDSASAQLLKNEGPRMYENLYNFIVSVWNSEKQPLD